MSKKLTCLESKDWVRVAVACGPKGFDWTWISGDSEDSLGKEVEGEEEISNTWKKKLIGSQSPLRDKNSYNWGKNVIP